MEIREIWDWLLKLGRIIFEAAGTYQISMGDILIQWDIQYSYQSQFLKQLLPVKRLIQWDFCWGPKTGDVGLLLST